MILFRRWRYGAKLKKFLLELQAKRGTPEWSPPPYGSCIVVKDALGIPYRDLFIEIANRWPKSAGFPYMVPDPRYIKRGYYSRQARDTYQSSNRRQMWIEGPYAELRWEMIAYVISKL